MKDSRSPVYLVILTFALVVIVSIVPATTALKCYMCTYSEIAPIGTGCENDDPPESLLHDCPSVPAGTSVCLKISGQYQDYSVVKRLCAPSTIRGIEDKCYSTTDLAETGVNVAQFGYPVDTDELTTCFCKDNDGCNGANGLQLSALVAIFLAAGAIFVSGIHPGI